MLTIESKHVNYYLKESRITQYNGVHKRVVMYPQCTEIEHNYATIDYLKIDGDYYQI